jgi:hypothetical protein
MRSGDAAKDAAFFFGGILGGIHFSCVLIQVVRHRSGHRMAVLSGSVELGPGRLRLRGWQSHAKCVCEGDHECCITVGRI